MAVEEPAPEPNPWWSALLIPALALAGVVLGLQVTAALRAVAHDLSMEDALHHAQSDLLNVAAVQAAGFGIAIAAGLLLFQRGRRTRVALSLGAVSPGVIALALVCGIALQFPLAELGNLAHELWPPSLAEQLLRRRMVTPDGVGSALAIIVGVVVVSPVTEELLFRGLLLPGLADRYGDGVALGLTSLAFGLIHVGPAALYATAAGVVLGLAALRTRSTFVPLAVHAGVNAVPVMLPEHVMRIDGFNTVAEDVYHLPVPLLVGAVVVSAAAFLAMTRLADR